MKWNLVGCLLVLTSMMPIGAYQKVCYLQPQYGRYGSYIDLKQVMDQGMLDGYVVFSPDGRKSCYVQLKAIDKNRVKFVLDKYGVDGQITDDLIEQLLMSKKDGRKTVGLILRDFKKENEGVTADQVKKALGK